MTSTQLRFASVTTRGQRRSAYRAFAPSTWFPLGRWSSDMRQWIWKEYVEGLCRAYFFGFGFILPPRWFPQNKKKTESVSWGFLSVIWHLIWSRPGPWWNSRCSEVTVRESHAVRIQARTDCCTNGILITSHQCSVSAAVRISRAKWRAWKCAWLLSYFVSRTFLFVFELILWSRQHGWKWRMTKISPTFLLKVYNE